MELLLAAHTSYFQNKKQPVLNEILLLWHFTRIENKKVRHLFVFFFMSCSPFIVENKKNIGLESISLLKIYASLNAIIYFKNLTCDLKLF